MIGHKNYSSDLGTPLPLSRSCRTSMGVPLPIVLPVIDPPELFLEKCTVNHVGEVSLLGDDGNGRRYGDYVVRFEAELFQNAVDALCDYWDVLINRYAVDRRQIEVFESEGVLFLQVDGRAFCHDRGHEKLYSIYVEMNRLLKQNMSVHTCDIVAASMLNPSRRYFPLFSDEWHSKKDLMDALDPSVDASHLFYDHSSDISINWIEYYHRHRPEPPKKMSFLREVYLRSKCSVEHGLEPVHQALGNLKKCALLQDVASTTSWEDEDELSFLGGLCGALHIRSFRRLCVCAGVSNPKMRESDYASSWLNHDLRCKYCEELAQKFQYKCPTDCGVTSPFAFPFMPTDFAGPFSLFFSDEKYVYHTTDGKADAGERVCSFYQAIQSLQDEYGEYWGYTMTPDHGRTFIPVKIAGDSKVAVLSSLEKAGVKIFKRDLAYQFALSVEDWGTIINGPMPLVQGRNHAGWTESMGYPVYSFPYRRYFEKPTVPFLHGGTYKGRYGQSGTLENWVQTLSRQALPDVMFLALAASCAGPLLDLIDCPSFGVHFWGGDSQYRKHVLRLAGSVWGGPRFAQSYLSLSMNLGEVVAAHNDSLIAVNISESVSQTRSRNLLQNILGGTSQDGQFGAPLKCVVVSTGKEPVKAGDDGTLILNFELPKAACVDWNKCSGFESNYGHVGPMVVRGLQCNLSENDLIACVERLRDAFPIKSVDSSVRQVFAVLNFALIRTSQILGLPLTITAVSNSFDRLLVGWAKKRDQFEQDAVDRVVNFIKDTANSARIGDAQKCVKHIDYDGYRFVDGRLKGILFPTKKFKKLFCDTVAPKRLAEMLHTDGLLITGKDGGLSYLRWIPSLGKSARGYYVRWPKKA